MNPEKAILPETVGAWKAAAAPRKIDAGNIFDYMNGAGELYLAYHFDHMLAWEYRDGSDNDLLVELYRMQGSDDAFGLLSLDWGGEAVAWPHGAKIIPSSAAVPPARALYGEGLLRLWSDDLYARVMAVRETPAAREAILVLAQAIVAGRSDPPPPALLRLLPTVLNPQWKLKIDRSAFIRSHLVLNSLYYLSHDNILGLDSSCEAVFTSYEKEGRRLHLLVIQYADDRSAEQGLAGFLAGYIPEGAKGGPATPPAELGFFLVEDGWLGFHKAGRRLAVVFQCPDLDAARRIVAQVGLEN